MYEWILWRHAEAGFARSDLERPLTDCGQQQAADSAAWIKDQGIKFPAYCSQATRAQQTVAYYDEHATVLDGLNPGCGFSCVRETLQQLEGQDAVIVGHLPWIHGITSELLGKNISAHDYSSVCWLQNDNGIWTLKAQYRF
ncbi:histidine phosphatase family protein [Cardiobacteriaceae bacterium TAE3-ERU3]|nr:histidine phosphatase family protein [Cardiobacteriaceae bacterium TAE3-ERU3]